MKSKIMIIIFTLFTGIESASAGLNVDLNPQQKNRPYSKITLKNEKSYWIFTGETDAGEATEDFLLIQEMDCHSKEKIRKIKTPNSYIVLTPLSESKWQNPLVIGANYLGTWDVMQLQDDLSGIRQSLALKDIGIIWASASSKDGYFIAGISRNKQPLLIFFNGNLKNRKTLIQASDRYDEVSSVFESRGRVFALSNIHGDNKKAAAPPYSELREYSSSGSPVSRTPMRGMVATGTALKDGGIAISYWIGEQLFMEKRDANLSILWSTKLHQRDGVATMKGNLLEAGSHIAWIGANDEKLLIHRLTQNGKLVQTSIDTKTNIGTPIPDIYSAHSSVNDIYIRGTAIDPKIDFNNTQQFGKVTPFCFTEKPDS